MADGEETKVDNGVEKDAELICNSCGCRWSVPVDEMNMVINCPKCKKNNWRLVNERDDLILG